MFSSWRLFQVGSGKGRAGHNGLWKVGTVPVGNVGTGIDDLMSTTLEANSWHSTGQTARIRVAGFYAANAASKNIILRLGSLALYTTGVQTLNNLRWMIEGTLTRTSSTELMSIFTGCAGPTGGTFVNFGLQASVIPAVPFTTAQILKCTGESVSNNDIVQDFLLVEAMTIGQPASIQS